MLYGFFVKMAIADNLQPFVHHVYAEPAPYNGAKLLFATCCFALQIYWDFAGYSHIAAGTASLFGVKLMQNFRYPYFACDIRDFWRRWHISLSTWFRDYVYIPLGGSRRTFPRTLANLMATFVLSGLWHGASWNFVLWGAWHGAGMVALVLWERWRDAGGGGCYPGTLRRAAGWAGTLAFVLGGWVLFRSADLRQAGEIFSGICLRPFAAEEAGRSLSNRFGMVPLVLAAAGLAVEWARRNALFPLDRLDRSGWPTAGRWLLYSAMIWLCLFYRHPGANTFIYFQF
jgi:D-alanyl-lipoteichoic acid acyltransferase DltB (MBOAT superfamily)